MRWWPIHILLLTFFTSLSAQEQVGQWDHYFSNASDSTHFFMVDSDFESDQFEIIRRLDADHSIVRAKNVKSLKSVGFRQVNDDWKLNISLKEGDLFYIRSVRDIDWDRYEVEILANYHRVYLIRTSEKELQRLKHDPAITYISNESSRPRTEARVIDMNLNPNRVNKIHRFFPDLDGSGMTVSIQENRYDEDDIDLRGRSVPSQLAAEVVSNHATEMATIVGGAGNSFLTGRGVADGINFTSSDFSMVLPDSDQDYLSLNVLTQNHSYGTEIELFYGAQARAFDESAFNNPNLLHVFSSGNEGTSTPSTGTYANVEGYANLTGNFKMAKNILVTGSVDTIRNEVSFASRGPAYDGRIKPEITAYSMVGSSNSAALVSGVASLLQQQYRMMNASDMPSALVKALLINAAEDVGAEGPDHITGYGSVDAFRSLELLQQNQFFSGTVSEGETLQFPVSVPANVINLKVTLSWTDPPADLGSFMALVNDLDLKLINSLNDETLPWVLNSNANVSDLEQPAVRGFDRLNNNEQITLDDADDTSYTIEVSGFDVSGTQDFYVVWQYDEKETFEWDYPTASDNMPYNGESGSYFRWKSTLSEVTGRLEYSTDGGTNWDMLDDNVDLARGYFRWNDIPDIQKPAIARMVAGSQNFATETFTISRPADVSVGFVCSDSVRLQWEPIEGSTSYEIYNMGDQTLELFDTTTDTASVIQNISALADSRFSIVPIVQGRRLVPSLTLDYTQQGIECFVFSFFQEVALDTGIYLNLSLGTVYGIGQVTFQRKNQSGVTIVETVLSPENRELRILDNNPDQGNNTHSVIIDFVNGEQIEQEASNTFYLTDLPVIVFPNPTENTRLLNVFTKELDAPDPRFRIFDSKGTEVVNFRVSASQNNIPLDALQPGMYFYRLENGAESYTGRLVIR